MNWARLRSKNWSILSGRRLGIGVTCAVIVLRLLGSLQFLELLALDRLQQLSPRESLDSRIILIGIDEKYPRARENQPLEYTDLSILIETILTHNPAIVGVDVVGDALVGKGDIHLLELFEEHKNLLTVKKIGEPSIAPLKGLSPTVVDEQVGFNDIAYDDDGHVRRMFLGRNQKDGTFTKSFPLLLAESYLKNNNDIVLDNGEQDIGAMRFDEVEIPRLQSHSGGYRQESEIYGVQTLINFRSGMRSNNSLSKPFRFFSASQITENDFNGQAIADKIVIIGSVDPNDVLEFDSAVPSQLRYNPHVLKGLELQAHATSQITSAALDGRPLIWFFSIGWEYILLVVVGLLSSHIYRRSKSTLQRIFILVFVNGLIALTGYLMLICSGLWLPIVPILLIQTVNGATYIAIAESESRWHALVKERDHALLSLKKERQKTIEQAFDTIHNGPLQTLSNLLRLIRDKELSQKEIGYELEKLNIEIRDIGESLKQESISDENFYIQVGQSKLDLNTPIHELFYEIYIETLKRPFPGFKALKIQARSLDPVDTANLSIECKRKLCRFFEETLCNVGKHALGATKLTVTGQTIGKIYSLKIIDNGMGFKSGKVIRGRGTKIARELEIMIRGKFVRKHNSPKGVFCEFQWLLS